MSWAHVKKLPLTCKIQEYRSASLEADISMVSQPISFKLGYSESY